MENERLEELGARCLTCDYLLRGLVENRCPECGRAFDPADPRTMDTGLALEPVAKWLLKPAGWPLAIAALVSALMTLSSVSVPGTYFLLFVLSEPLWFVVGVIWVVRLLASLVIAWRRRQATFGRWSTWRRWAVAPMIVVVTILLLVTDVPLHLTFRASRSSMDRLAQLVLDSPSNAPEKRWVGLYPAERIEVIPGGMRFLVRGAGFLDQEGFAYSPNGPPTIVGEDHYQHLFGAWYIWRESW